MRKIFGTFMVLGLLTACGDDDPVTVPRELTWSGNITGLAGFTGISGEAEFEWTVGTSTFTATAEIAGDVQGSVRPWHVHSGTCATDGPIVGVDADYPRLTVAANGSDTATATVNVAIDSLASYHVNYHLSPTAMTTYIACGNLTRQ